MSAHPNPPHVWPIPHKPCFNLSTQNNPASSRILAKVTASLRPPCSRTPPASSLLTNSLLIDVDLRLDLHNHRTKSCSLPTTGSKINGDHRQPRRAASKLKEVFFCLDTSDSDYKEPRFPISSAPAHSPRPSSTPEIATALNRVTVAGFAAVVFFATTLML